MTESIDLVFDIGATLGLSYVVMKGNSDVSENKGTSF